MQTRERDARAVEERPEATRGVAGGPLDSLESHGLYRLGLGYGRLVHRLRWLIIALWLAGVAAGVPFAARVGSVLAGGGFSAGSSESSRAAGLIARALRQPATRLLVVFQSSGATAADPDYQREVGGFVAAAGAQPHVIGVTPGGVGRDGRTMLVVVSFDQGSGYVQQHLAELRALVPSGADAGPARVYFTGDAPVTAAIRQITGQDTERAELAALPLALVVLVLVFGTLVAALMPLLLAMVAVPIALALIYVVALHTSTNVFVLNIASIIGLGIAIDYSLFMTRRFRAELAEGRPVREAVAWTVATAGEAILFSGLTVAIGFVGLYLIGVPLMSSFATGGALVVAAAVLASLTLLPALLGVLGPRINSLRVPLLGRLAARPTRLRADAGRRGFWQAWALAVMRRPVLVVLGVVVLLAGIGWPVLALNVGTLTSDSLPAGVPARQGLDILAAQFPDLNANTLAVVVQAPDGSSMLTAANLARLDALSGWLAAQRDVSAVAGLTRLPATPGAPALGGAQLAALYESGAYRRVPGLARLVAATTAGDTTLVTVTTPDALDSPAAKALVDRLRAGDRAAAGGLTVLVGGSQAASLDYTRYLYGNFPRAILVIVAATYILLLLMFRSVVLPLKAILMNALSVGAAYGVLVAVFQWGAGARLLGFSAAGDIDSFIPILMFCILFGLSMDYEVFLLSRVREEWLLTHDNRLAVAHGLEQTGGVITNAALLFVIVTGAFTFTRLMVTKEIGLGMTVAVLLDAAVIRMLLVPATMRLLGRWNWWLPGRPLPAGERIHKEDTEETEGHGGI
jgi:RND superfamily putative drug exporter